MGARPHGRRRSREELPTLKHPNVPLFKGPGSSFISDYLPSPKELFSLIKQSFLKKSLIQRYLPMRSPHRSKMVSFMRKMVYKSTRFVSKIAKSQFGQSFE